MSFWLSSHLIVLMRLLSIQDQKGRHLLEIAHRALRVGIGACSPGRPFRDIGGAIHSFIHGLPFSSESDLSESQYKSRSRPQCDDVIYSICTAFTGHGIGSEFHMQPWIIHTSKHSLINTHTLTQEPTVLYRK